MTHKNWSENYSRAGQFAPKLREFMIPCTFEAIFENTITSALLLEWFECIFNDANIMITYRLPSLDTPWSIGRKFNNWSVKFPERESARFTASVYDGSRVSLHCALRILSSRERAKAWKSETRRKNEMEIKKERKWNTQCEMCLNFFLFFCLFPLHGYYYNGKAT